MPATWVLSPQLRQSGRLLQKTLCLGSLIMMLLVYSDLKVRRFVDSPATLDCIHALRHAPIGFAGSLTELHLELDTWREQDATTAPLKPYPRASRVAVLHTLSQLRNLELLKIRDRGALVGVDCDGGRVLRQLKDLTRVEVERYPCGSCVVDCLHFHADFPFQSMENM